MILRHCSCAESKTGRDYSRQTLWNGSNCQSNRDFEVVDSALKSSTMNWIIEI